MRARRQKRMLFLKEPRRFRKRDNDAGGGNAAVSLLSNALDFLCGRKRAGRTNARRQHQRIFLACVDNRAALRVAPAEYRHAHEHAIPACGHAPRAGYVG